MAQSDPIKRRLMYWINKKQKIWVHFTFTYDSYKLTIVFYYISIPQM